MKVENWNKHEIRFVQKDGEWWAVLKDICEPLGLRTPKVVERLPDDVLSKDNVKDTCGRNQEMLIVSELGIYEAFANSRKPEAQEFRRWMFEVVKELRKSTGLEGFEVFRMLDKEHQKEAMRKLRESVQPEDPIPYMKANTIANKAVSNRYGYPKMIKKGDMDPKMLAERETILDDTVELMKVQKKYDLDLSVSEEIYKKWN